MTYDDVEREALHDWLDERDALERDVPSPADLISDDEWRDIAERDLDQIDAGDFLLGDRREYNDTDMPF